MRVLLCTLLITFTVAQKGGLEEELKNVFGSAPGLESSTAINVKQQLLQIFGDTPINTQGTEVDVKQQVLDIFGGTPINTRGTEVDVKQQVLDIFGDTSVNTRGTEVDVKQQVLDIFGGTPINTRGSAVDVKQQVLDIFGGTPINTRGSAVDVKQQVADIFGDPIELEPIDELTLPRDIYLDIFGSDENEINETPENTSPFNTETSLRFSITTSTESTSTVATRPEITSLSSVTRETTITQTIKVNPTETPPTLVGNDGAPCKCLPYYLCDKDQNGRDYNNASVTGWGELDIRFGEDDAKPIRKCQETVELCCTIPKEMEPITRPTGTPIDPVTVKPAEKPKLKGCGYRNPKGVDFTITGGTGREAQYGEFPWVVALIASNGSLVGVGGIIHPQVIITGAHIAAKFTPGTLKIRAGEWDTSTTKERLAHQEREIQEIYSHHDFHPKSLRNDMALLRLTEPLNLDQHINMICLPDQDESFDTSVGCIANGWGKDVFGMTGRYAVILKKVEINMVAYNRCLSLLRRTRVGPDFVLHNSFVCAGGEEGKDLCTGDGGAPLVCPLGDDRFKLTGLVAWGIGCGGKDIPAVYAGVSNFRDMIDAKMNEWGYGTSSYTI